MIVSDVDMMCFAGGFGASMILFWVVEAVFSVFTVFCRGD